MADIVEIIISRIGEEFDGECHLTEAEARLAISEIERRRIDIAAKETEALGYLRAVGTIQARLAELEKALEETRATNRRLNRRVQISEAIQQSADDYLSAWIKVFSANSYPSDRRFKERHFIKYILRDLRYRISKLSARAALDQDKGGSDGDS